MRKIVQKYIDNPHKALAKQLTTMELKWADKQVAQKPAKKDVKASKKPDKGSGDAKAKDLAEASRKGQKHQN